MALDQEIITPSGPQDAASDDRSLLGFAHRYWLVQLLLLIAMIAPLALFALFSFKETDRQMEEQTLVRRQAVAYFAAATLRDRFDRFAGIGASVAGQKSFLDAVRGGRWADAAKAAEVVPREQATISRVVMVDPEGRVRAVAPDGDEPGPTDLSAEAWFVRLRSQRKPVVSDVLTLEGDPPINVVYVAVPVPSGADGELLAALVMEIRTSVLLEWARAIDVGLSGTAMFIDGRGRLAAHPLYSASGPVKDFSGYPGVSDLLSGKGGTRVVQYEGQEIIVAAEPVKEYGWSVIVSQPKSLAFAPREQYLMPIATSYAVILVVNLVLALGILRVARANREAFVRERAYLSGIGDGVIAVDVNGDIVRANPHAEELLGWTAEELRGRSFIDLVPFLDEKGEKVPVTFRPLAFALRSGRMRSISTTPTYYYVRKDGGRFPVAATATPLLENGKAVGAVLNFRDITPEKQIDRAKTEFVSLASHQLLSPASAVKGYVHLLRDGDLGPLEPRQKDVVDKTIVLMDRMIGLVDTLLNVSRIELGTFSVHPEPTDLRRLAQGVILELTPKLKEKDIQFSQYFDVDLPTVNVDPNLVSIVVQNLLTNAVRYSPHGGSIALSIEQRPSVAVITVADKGIGIPKVQQTKIFTKFFRADNARSAAQEGNGLGLYMVRSIIEHAGGRVWFTSDEGRGTTFYVTLPLAGMQPREGAKTLDYTA